MINWFAGIGGVLMFVGCLAVSILLIRFIRKGFLALGEPLVTLLSIFLFIVGANGLIHGLGTTNMIYPILFRVISGIAAVYLAWRIFTEREWPESIYESNEIMTLKEISKKIQDHTKIGFWWKDGVTIRWSSGMYEIYEKDTSWIIDYEELERMVHPDDRQEVRTVRTIGGEYVFRLEVPQRKYLRIVSKTGDYGTLQDITAYELTKQALQIELNDARRSLSLVEAQRTVDSFIKQTHEPRSSSHKGS